MNEPIHPVQLEALKRATPAQKLEAVAALYAAGIRLRMAGLRMSHPERRSSTHWRASRFATA